MKIPFLKMNGLGNDFVVVDARAHPFEPTVDQVRKWGNRETGIGFDQLIFIGRSEVAHAFMHVWNNDGSRVETCGNALRCIGHVLLEETGLSEVRIETLAGVVSAARAAPELGFDNGVAVDMGAPRLDWHQIPLAEEMDTRGIELQVGPIDAPLYHTPGAVSMGNPHVVFFVPDAEAVEVEKVGSLIENHPLFPEATNVEFAQVIAPDLIRFRVWERGAGLTRACGTGSCAVLVAAVRKGLSARKAKILMDGGALVNEWRESDGHVIMTGPVSLDFAGELSL